MKTPLQQLIERLEILRDNSEGFSAEIEAYQKAIDEAKSLLDKESNELDEVSKFDETEWTWDDDKIIRECTYTESYMNRHGPAKYKNRYGDEFTFLLNEDGDLIMEGNFEHFRFGYSNIYDVAYKEYIKDTNSDISLDEFKKLAHQYNDDTNTWELDGKYRKLVVTSDEYNMIDPSGGPYITLGMESKLFHPDTEGKIIGKILMLEEGVKLVLIEKGKGEQRELLKQMMQDDERDGIYET